jgi:hypothetical protein
MKPQSRKKNRDVQIAANTPIKVKLLQCIRSKGIFRKHLREGVVFSFHKMMIHKFLHNYSYLCLKTLNLHLKH